MPCLDHELASGLDEQRAAQVIAEADRLLDTYFPLERGSHADTSAYRVEEGELVAETDTGRVGLAEPAQFAGYRGDPGAPTAVLLRRHGLHAELSVDAGHRVGRGHHAHVADVLLESAVTTIVDLEDSVATVDGPDKVGAYRTWLGLMTGGSHDLPPGGRDVTRSVADDRTCTAPDGGELVLRGRALLLVRNVGHHMRLSAVRAAASDTGDGEPVLEEALDLLVSAVAALYDLRGIGRFRNSRRRSLYVVKPKMHGPDEVSLSADLHRRRAGARAASHHDQDGDHGRGAAHVGEPGKPASPRPPIA